MDKFHILFLLLAVSLMIALEPPSSAAAPDKAETVMLSTAPYLPVKDMEPAAKFYTEVLGFTITHQEGGAFTMLKCGEVDLALTRATGDFSPGACMIKVRGIDGIYARCQAAGATIKSPLERKPWGMRMFIVLDTAGNALDFAEHDE